MSVALRSTSLLAFANDRVETPDGPFYIGNSIDSLVDSVSRLAWMRPAGSGAVRVIAAFTDTRSAVNPWLNTIISFEKVPEDWVLPEDVAQVLGAVKDELSLNTSELATALRVSRPTIYSWTEGGQASQENRLRLAELQKLTAAWQNLSSEPLGTLVRERGADGSRIVDFLSEDVLPRQAIIERFKIFASLIQTRSASQRGGNRSFRELAREHNLKPISDERFRENVRSVAQRRAR